MHFLHLQCSNQTDQRNKVFKGSYYVLYIESNKDKNGNYTKKGFYRRPGNNTTSSLVSAIESDCFSRNKGALLRGARLAQHIKDDSQYCYYTVAYVATGVTEMAEYGSRKPKKGPKIRTDEHGTFVVVNGQILRPQYVDNAPFQQHYHRGPKEDVGRVPGTNVKYLKERPVVSYYAYKYGYSTQVTFDDGTIGVWFSHGKGRVGDSANCWNPKQVDKDEE